MKIGIDAKWYFEGPPSGRRVVRNLVDHLLKMDTENQYYLFLNKKHKDRPFSRENERIHRCYVWAGNNLVSNLLVLPRLASRFNLDIVLYQNFISPLGHGKKVAYIHDVLFLSNPEFYTLWERLYFAPLKRLTKWAHAIITVSEEEKKRLMRFHFCSDAGKITVAYHGVDEKFMPIENYHEENIRAIKKKYKLPDSYLLFVGRLNLRKNVDHLLRAIPLLKDKEIPLLIVGDEDWKKSNHREISKTLRIENRIIFTGGIFEDLGLVYALARVFCFPSYAESFGLPPLEAMASGVPVVVSNTTSLPEVCGDAGTYVKPDSQEEIASAIDNLLTNSQLYADKRQRGLERSKKFTWEKAAEVVLNCMKSCAAK